MKSRLFFFINSFDFGGAERVASVLLNHRLFRETFEIHLALMEERIKYPLGSHINLHTLTEKEGGSGFSKMLGFLGFRDKLIQLKKSIKPHISLSFLTRSNLLNIVSRQSGEKLFISERNDTRLLLGSNPLKKMIFTPLIRLLYPKADGIIGVSQKIKDSLVRGFSIDQSKIRVINNPVDIENIERQSEEEIQDKEISEILKNNPTAISVGRLNIQKGYPIALEAVKKVRERFPLHYIIIGEGELKEELQQKAKELQIEEWVHFIGWRDNPHAYIKRAHLFILPSLWEGFCNVLVEAMTCQTPVIASDKAGANGEVIKNNQYGLLFTEGDAQALAEKMTLLLSNPEKARKYGEKAKERARDFHSDKICAEYINYLTWRLLK